MSEEEQRENYAKDDPWLCIMQKFLEHNMIIATPILHNGTDPLESERRPLPGWGGVQFLVKVQGK